ncbi:MAG: amidohydrolase family protein [Albidovulum sp.]|uniref:amidohydrolase family protein n=1 Tax=Albidovulum sp. TaxID=1872424 RepID=UPI003CB978CE
MDQTIVIRKADWIIGWDIALGGHTYLRGGDVAFRGDRIVQVGGHFEGVADREIVGAGKCVMPGLVDLHSHPYSEPMNKGFATAEVAGQNGERLWVNDLIVFRKSDDDRRKSAAVAYAEMLASGVTTAVDISYPYEGWVELAASSGLRVCLAPAFAGGNWEQDDAFGVRYAWKEDDGRAAYAASVAVIDAALAEASGRLSGMMMPAQVDTCSEALLRDSWQAAQERGLRWQTHAAQLVTEFQEITRRHGMTPIRWLNSIGVLAPGSILAHCILLDHHSQMRSWGTRGELELLAETGTAVAHCPTIFARQSGLALEDFGRYRGLGIPVGIGTDTFPHNMLEEMRLAMLIARVTSARVDGASIADVFNAATIDGAKALGRDDIGRIAVGAKADIVLLNLDHPSMLPLSDPLTSLLHQAADRAVHDVFVDGRQVVAAGQVLTIDLPEATRALGLARETMARRAVENDRKRRTLDEIAPLPLPVRSHVTKAVAEDRQRQPH